MSQFTIQSPEGKTVTLEGATPPSESDLNEIFRQIGQSGASAAPLSSTSNPSLPSSIGRGIVQGGQEMLGTGVNTYELMSKLIGQRPSSKPREFLKASQEGLDQLIPPAQGVGGKIAEGIGQVPGMVATYGLLPESKVLPAAGIIGAINSQEGGAGSMVKGGLRNMTLMALLGASQKLGAKNPLAGALMGGAVSGAANDLAGGDQKDTIAQAALGAGFSMYPQDVRNRIQKDYNLAKQFADDPKGNFKQVFDVLKEDPVNRTMRNVNDRERALNQQLQGVNPQFADLQRTKIDQATNMTKEDLAAIEALKSSEQKRFDAQEMEVKKNRALTVAKLQDSVQSFEDQMPQAAYEKAKYIQNNYKRMFGQATEQYGKQLDITASKIPAIPQETAFNILGSALDKSINDYGSSDTTFAKKIIKLQGKYEPGAGIPAELRDVVASMSAEQLDQFKKDNPGVLPESKSVPFKDFYGDVKTLLSGMEPSEHNTAILRREVGKFVASVDPTFQDLQDEYSHVASYREELSKVFHPYDGPAALKSGEKWMSQFGKGEDSTNTYTDQKLLSFLEKGFTGSKISMSGMGDISSGLKQMGSALDSLKVEIKSSNDPIFSKYASQMAEIGQTHIRTMEQLEAKKQLTKDALDHEVQKIKSEIAFSKAQAIFDIEMKRKIYEKARVRTRKLDETRKRLEGISSAIGLGAAGAGLWKASRFFRASLMARKAMRLRGRMR